MSPGRPPPYWCGSHRHQGWWAAHKVADPAASPSWAPRALPCRPPAGLIVKGNLSFSLTLGALPPGRPYVVLQSLATGHVPEKLGLIGVALVVALLSAGRWSGPVQLGLPVNLVTDAASPAFGSASASRAASTSPAHPLLAAGR